MVPITLLTVWSVIALAIGFGIRRIFGERRLALTLVVFCLLLPWAGHHLHVISQANAWISKGSYTQRGLGAFATILGPTLVLCYCAISIATAKKWRHFVVAGPAWAFLVTWYVSFPLVFRAAPDDFYFDNIPNILLFVWTVGATLLLFAFWWRAFPNTKQ